MFKEFIEGLLNVFGEYIRRNPKSSGTILVALLLGGTLVWNGKTIYLKHIKPELCSPEVAIELPNQASKKIIETIDTPILIYRKIGSHIYIIDTNNASRKFYRLTEEQMKNKTPEELHVNVRNYMSNYSDWAAEQNDRKARANQGEPLGKTLIPMKLESHPDFEGEWYLSSTYLDADQNYIFTRFFQ